MPNKENVADVIEDLRNQIRHHDELYYQKAAPEISDQDYDALLRQLVELETAHPDLITPDSPSQRVGGKPIEGFTPVRHAQRMMSIDNTYDEAEVREFDARLKRNLHGEPYAYTCEPKIDGVSLSLRYENGTLAVAATRGDGTTGDDVTANARTVRDIPLKLAFRKDAPAAIKALGIPGVLEVRGEIFMSRQQFAAINAQREEAGEEVFANPRNSTAGTLKQLDSRIVAARKLEFIPHGYGDIDGLTLTHYHQWQEYLAALGFRVSPVFKTCADVDAVIAYLNDFAASRLKLPYDTDGVVIKLDNLEQRSALGATAKAPRWCIAFKYQPEQAETTLAKVTFNVGKTGSITPAAEFDPPVFISGTNVYRATLHNYDEIERKDIRLFDRVLVQKAGEIIPYVVGVVIEKRPANAQKIERPAACPSCGTKDLEHDGGFVRCPNPSCPNQLAERLFHFAGRGQMDIENLGEKLILQLLETGLVKSLPDLYRLTHEQLAALERMGDKSAANVIASIDGSRKRPLSKLLGALGIRHIGVRTAQVITEQYDTLDKLRAATLEEITAIHGIGDIVARSLYDFLHSDAGKATLDELAALGLNTVEPKIERTGPQPLAGKTIVVTGTLKNFTRSQIKNLIEKNGGKAGDSVSKATAFVVAGEEAGSKLDKARKLGVEVIDEDEFVKRIETA